MKPDLSSPPPPAISPVPCGASSRPIWALGLPIIFLVFTLNRGLLAAGPPLAITPAFLQPPGGAGRPAGTHPLRVPTLRLSIFNDEWETDGQETRKAVGPSRDFGGCTRGAEGPWIRVDTAAMRW